jgi:hypothetical protein
MSASRNQTAAGTYKKSYQCHFGERAVSCIITKPLKHLGGDIHAVKLALHSQMRHLCDDTLAHGCTHNRQAWQVEFPRLVRCLHMKKKEKNA